MSQEQMKILQMLEEGKITVEEATDLLKRVQRNSTAEATPAGGPAATSIRESAHSFAWGDWLKALIAGFAKEQVEEHFDWNLECAAIHTIAAQTVNGSLEYVGAEQATIAIHAQKCVKAPDLSTATAFAGQVQIRIEEKEGTLTIYPDYPKPPPHIEVQVSFVIHGPRTLNLRGHSTNGHVQISGVEGVVQAHSTNGEVQVEELTGTIQAKSTNGNVRAQRLTLTAASEFVSQNGALNINIREGQAPITAATVNGSLHLQLPPAYTGQLDARTQNGHVRSAFPIRASHQTRNRLVGPIGAGGEAQVKLRSQNGNVTLAMAA